MIIEQDQDAVQRLAERSGFGELNPQAVLDKPMTVRELRALIDLFPVSRQPQFSAYATDEDLECRYLRVLVKPTQDRRWFVDFLMATKDEPFSRENVCFFAGARSDDGFRLVTRRGNERRFRTLEALVIEMRQITGEHHMRLVLDLYRP